MSRLIRSQRFDPFLKEWDAVHRFRLQPGIKASQGGRIDAFGHAVVVLADEAVRIDLRVDAIAAGPLEACDLRDPAGVADADCVGRKSRLEVQPGSDFHRAGAVEKGQVCEFLRLKRLSEKPAEDCSFIRC